MEHRRRSAPTTFHSSDSSTLRQPVALTGNLARPASPSRRQGSRISQEWEQVGSSQSSTAAANSGAASANAGTPQTSTGNSNTGSSPTIAKNTLNAGANDVRSRQDSNAGSAENSGGTDVRKQDSGDGRGEPSPRSNDAHYVGGPFRTHESTDSLHSGGYGSPYGESIRDTLSSADSAVFIEAMERTANAVAHKICPELSAVIQASLAEQARDLVKLLQPLCSELGVVAHRLTLAVQRSEMKSTTSPPLEEAPSSSDSSMSEADERASVRAASKNHSSPKSLTRATMSPTCSSNYSSNERGETKRTREPRVASAPELPLPTKKISTHKAIEKTAQSVTLSALPDVRFGTNETEQEKPLDKKHPSKRSAGMKYFTGDRQESPQTQPTLPSANDRQASNSWNAKRYSEGPPRGEKLAASLIGVSRGKKTSSWQHLSHTTELRFLQDSLASELFKATYLVPGSSPSTPLPSKPQKSWMSAIPSGGSTSSPKSVQAPFSHAGSGKVNPASLQRQQSNASAQMSNGSHASPPRSIASPPRHSLTSVLQHRKISNGSPTTSKEAYCLGQPHEREPHESQNAEDFPERQPRRADTASPSTSSGGSGMPEEPLRCERPSYSAPAAQSTLLSFPALSGESDGTYQSEDMLGSRSGEKISDEEDNGLRRPRRRSLSHPPQGRGGLDAAKFGNVGTLSSDVNYLTCPKTAKEVRQLNEQELTKSIRSGSIVSSDSIGSKDDHDNQPLSMRYSEPTFEPAAMKHAMGSFIAAVLLRICGVLPWSQRFVWFSFLYFWVLVLLVILAIASCVQQVFQEDLQSRTSMGKLSDAVITLGALCVLLSCRAFQRELGDCTALLVSYAEKRGFLEHWAKISKRDAIVSFLVWIIILLERVRSVILMPESNFEDDMRPKLFVIFGMVGFIFASGLLMMLVHYILYIARCLSSMIDTFCCRFVELPDFTEAVTEWNVLQAVIRKSCETIQYCFFALQTTTTVAALLNVVLITRQVKEGYKPDHFLDLLPGALTVLVVIRMFFCAGAVTDKCARVPSLVNSLSFGTTDLDRDRLYVVEYIAHSQAGFYIFEVRLTSATVLKTFYFSCVIALALATRVASDF